MNGFIVHSLKLKTLSCLLRKFFSSAALLENPSTEFAGHSSKFNPHDLLNNPRHLRGLTLKEAKVAHTLLLKTPVLYSNIIAANNLVDLYSEWGRTDHAFTLFEEIPERHLVTWNLMILGCNKNSLFEESWRVFCKMHNLGVGMDEFSYGSVLSACGSLDNVVRGEQVYGLVTKNGFFWNGYLRAGMIDLFSRVRRIEDALRVLYDVRCENVVCWNAVVSGAVKNNKNWIALEIFSQLCCRSSVIPNSFTFSSALTACAAIQELDVGRSIQGRVIKSGGGADVFVGTATVDMYAKCGVMADAMKQFKLMQVCNIVSWTALISGFVHNGDSASAKVVLNEMRKTGEEVNKYAISSTLAACANSAMFTEATQIHCWILKIGFCSDPVVRSSLITVYSNVGAISLSEVAFSETYDLKQVGIWNSMISAYAQNKIYEKAIILLQQMLKMDISPDQFSMSSILSITDSLSLGRQLHVYALKAGLLSDVSVGSSIFTMYSKCGNLEESVKAFDQLEVKDDVSWTSMIAGFAENGCPEMAIQMFRDIQFKECIPDEMSLSAVLTACSAQHSIELGRQIHCFSIRRGFGDQRIGGALVNMYSKCGDLNSARIVYHMMPLKDQVSFSSLISGFAQNGLIEEALQLFRNHLQFDMGTDSFTISSILGALANSDKSGIGTQLHVHIIKLGLESEASVGSSLIMMYSKHGSINDCRKVFRKIRNPDLVSWTTIIASYAQHGKGSEALEVFDLMKKSGIEPDAVTFVGVLSACCHTGLVEEGYFHLNSMSKDYGIDPGYKHYACMVDLLGRAGRLEEAERFIINMPIEPDTLIWQTLLASCKVHGNHELGKLVAEKIMELQPSNAGAYISLSNMCADAGEWDRVLEIRDAMEETGVRKEEPGWSYL